MKQRRLIRHETTIEIHMYDEFDPSSVIIERQVTDHMSDMITLEVIKRTIPGPGYRAPNDLEALAEELKNS